MTEKPPQRVACYIDGFNLYYGMRETYDRRFLWLDLCGLARSLLLPNQELVQTKYFTARISGGKPTDRPDYKAEMDARRKRQVTYLDALKTLDHLTIHEGQFLPGEIQCNKCGATWSSASEKMTDVNIATEMIVDAFANRFDTALLISGDSDLVPPVRAVRRCLGHKRVIVAFPPGRTSVELKNAASGEFVISRNNLKKNQLPEEITLPSGYKLKRPESWAPPVQPPTASRTP